MDSKKVDQICRDCLEWAKKRDYAGWDPYDGLNSPILAPMGRNWLTRLLAIHGVNKAPINFRPFLRIPQERNPKGIALFASAYLNRYEQTGEQQYLTEAESLLDWLRENQSTRFDLPAWGYNFPWQNGRKFFLPKHYPNAVVTIYCGRAFLNHYEQTDSTESLEIARGAAEFIRTGINSQMVDGYSVFTYSPIDSFVVINVNALAANYFYRVQSETGDSNLRARSEELFEFVCDAQDPKGAWYYSMPASESHLSHDNFHTGFVLESLYEYAMEQTPKSDAREAYSSGIEFYKKHLLQPSGAPKFESDQKYPYDAHAAAQAVLTLVQRGNGTDYRLAGNVLNWTLGHLYNKEGYFFRRKGRLLTDQTPYIRWSQAWMCRALSKFTLALAD